MTGPTTGPTTGPRTRQVVVVSAGLSVPSSTRLLAGRLGDAVTTAFDRRGDLAEVRHVELRELAHQLTDHLLTGFAPLELDEVQEAVRRADALVAVTPVFSASFSGLFKTFFDVLEPGSLEGKPVLVAATAGTARHSLVLDHALRPLFSYLRAVVVPTGVFAATDDFGAGGDGELGERISRAAGELTALVAGGGRTAAVDPSAAATVRPRRTTDEEFAEPTPFEELLRQASGGH